MQLKFTSSNLEIKIIGEKLFVHSGNKNHDFDVHSILDIGVLDLVNEHEKSLKDWKYNRSIARNVIGASFSIAFMGFLGLEFSQLFTIILSIFGLFLFFSGLILVKKSGKKPKRRTAIRIVTKEGNCDYPFNRTADHSMSLEEFIEKAESILRQARLN